MLERLNPNHPWVDAILIKVLVNCSSVNDTVLFGGFASCSVDSAYFVL